MFRFGLVILLYGVTGCSKPVADFLLENKEFQAPTSIKLHNSSQNAEKYLWFFGDGATSIEPNPTHRYVLSGKYTITLKAMKGTKSQSLSKNIYVEAPQDCLLELETTMGVITIKLYDNTPLHRDNFIKLAESGFYDSLLFHRVIKYFVIQAGDPQSKHGVKDQNLGGGGPGYTLPSEILQGNYHVRGAIAAARTGDDVNPQKNSSGSQFYIVQGQTVLPEELDLLARQKRISYGKDVLDTYSTIGGAPQLDNEYTVFGIVVSGLDVVDKIANGQTNNEDRPLDDVQIIKIRVIK